MHKRRLAVMQQGKVIFRMRLLIGLDRLRQLGHHRAKGIVLVEPMGKQMHPDTRYMGRDPDDLCARGNRPMPPSVTRAALATIEPPSDPPAVDMAKAHRNRSLPLADLVEEHPARALQILLEHAPQQGLLNFAQLSARIKGWTWLFSEVILALDELHGFILLEKDISGGSLHIRPYRSMSVFILSKINILETKPQSRVESTRKSWKYTRRVVWSACAPG